MKAPLILLAEDEPDLAHILRDTLVMLGFRVQTAADGCEALRHYRELRPDIIVTDVMMPRMDGFSFVRQVRAVDRHTPVIFLTARTETDDVVSGFKMGADDYLRKPFAMRELVVRIESILNRRAPTASVQVAAPAGSNASGGAVEPLRAGRFVLSPAAQELRFAETPPQSLTHRETEILRRLFCAPGEVVETRPLLLALWGGDTPGNARSLHVFISKLRTKLSLDPRLRIHNVHGVGYKMTIEGENETE